MSRNPDSTISTAVKRDDAIAMVALGLVDLRAQFEQQLRLLTHLEQYLLGCRDASDTKSFAACVETFRAGLTNLAVCNETIRDVLRQVDIDAEPLGQPIAAPH